MGEGGGLETADHVTREGEGSESRERQGGRGRLHQFVVGQVEGGETREGVGAGRWDREHVITGEVRESRTMRFWERSREEREERGAGQSGLMVERKFLARLR